MCPTDTTGGTTYTAALDLLAALILDAYRRDPAAVLARVRRQEQAAMTAQIRADDAAFAEAEADREIRRQLAARYDCRPDDVVRTR